ncbi:hypothetical protein BKA70DRAFT_1417839 [Coprinopsis sp. MPI-PUGE-AT-0042]|nr:hypothetical protein BKA70DRAFT_1417839 [Coprinopsis sp. MPI-PUGE-AT-0042]
MPPPMLQNVTTGSVQDLPAPTKPNNNPLSVFLIITAKAYSSIGFGLSVLAIWIRWFIPGSQKDVTQPSPVQAKAIAAKVPARRHKKLHSNPHVPQISRPTPLRRASAPPDSSHLVPIFRQGNEQIPDDANRRVCFADAPNTPSRRNTSPLQRSQTLPELEEEADPSPPPTATFVHLLTESPPASAVASIEPSLVQLSPPVTPEAIDMVETNSNSNSPSSTPRQRKLKLGFALMNRRSGADKESPSQPEGTTKATRKSSYPFPWTNSRKLSSESAASVEASSSSKASSSKSSSPCPSAASLPSMLQKKSYRRVSAPASRTSPYEAPYFATPPLVLDDSYSHYLRKLPQFDDEVASNPSHSSRSSTDRPSSSSGISRKIQRPTPKRRPASVGGWEE